MNVVLIVKISAIVMQSKGLSCEYRIKLNFGCFFKPITKQINCLNLCTFFYILYKKKALESENFLLPVFIEFIRFRMS